MAVLLGIAAVAMVLPKCNERRELRRRKTELLEENLRLANSTRELTERHERFAKEPAFVERVAKESGMIKSDEIVFRYSNDPSGEAMAPARANSAEAAHSRMEERRHSR